MANHVTNKLTVRKGTQKIIPALYSGTIECNSIDKKLYDILRNFSFNKIIKEKGDDHEWRWDNWGTRTDAYVLDNPDEWQNEDETINLITTDLEDINVIPIQEYIVDIKKRVKISNHEVSVLIKDLTWVYNKSKPTIDQGLETLVNVYNKIGKAVAKSYDTKAKTDDVN